MVPGGSMRRSFWDQAFSSDGRWGSGGGVGYDGCRCDEERAKRVWV